MALNILVLKSSGFVIYLLIFFPFFTQETEQAPSTSFVLLWMCYEKWVFIMSRTCEVSSLMSQCKDRQKATA